MLHSLHMAEVGSLPSESQSSALNLPIHSALKAVLLLFFITETNINKLVNLSYSEIELFAIHDNTSEKNDVETEGRTAIKCDVN